jgi:hypothetical protein
MGHSRDCLPNRRQVFGFLGPPSLLIFPLSERSKNYGREVQKDNLDAGVNLFSRYSLPLKNQKNNRE